MIIDFHTHIFPDKIAGRAIGRLSESSGLKPSTDGTASGLCGSMKRAGIGLSVNLPVMTRSDQVDKVNERLLTSRPAMEKMGIISFGGMHPDYAGYKEKLRFLAREGVRGIKLHPAYQSTDLDDPKMMKIIDAASELGLIVIIHAGTDVGIHGHNYADISMILNVINEVRPERFVLAHMGGWYDWDNVKKYIAGADVWFDTAFSIGRIDSLRDDADHYSSQWDRSGAGSFDEKNAENIRAVQIRESEEPPASEDEGSSPVYRYNLTPDRFVALCRAHGTGRILFGTDCPWSDQKRYVDAVRSLPFSEDEMSGILGENAARLLSVR